VTQERNAHDLLRDFADEIPGYLHNRAICEALDVRIDEAALTQALEIRLALYRRWFHPRPGAVETLRTCCERGYRTALISMCAPDAPAMWRASDLSPFVDVEVFSSEVGLRKPDPKIYELACRELGVPPERTAFLDDIGGNLKPARALGMATIKVDTPEQALRELAALLGFDLV